MVTNLWLIISHSQPERAASGESAKGSVDAENMLCASAQPPTLTAAFAAYGLESYDAGGDADAGGRGLRASPAGPGLRAGA